MGNALGSAGEQAVADHLEQAGWKIIDRNWRTRRGEIDIIALHGQTLVFIEVKTWPHGTVEDLEFVINAAKRKRMVETSKCFLSAHRQYSGMYIRFDVILVQSVPGSAPLRMEHISDAFPESE